MELPEASCCAGGLSAWIIDHNEESKEITAPWASGEGAVSAGNRAQLHSCPVRCASHT